MKLQALWLHFLCVSGISPAMYFVYTIIKFHYCGSYLSPFPAFLQKWAKTRIRPAFKVMVVPSLES